MRKLHALLLGALMTIGVGSMYMLAQQYGRSAANDVPTALAESVSAQLKSGIQPGDVAVSVGRADIANSFNPFVVVYGKDFRPVVGTGYLDGQLARIDKGVFSQTKEGKYHTVTWQPQSGVRIASVETQAGGYYVMAGQSLKLVENRATTLFKLAALGWLTSMVVVVIGYIVLRPNCYALMSLRADSKSGTNIVGS